MKKAEKFQFFFIDMKKSGKKFSIFIFLISMKKSEKTSLLLHSRKTFSSFCRLQYINRLACDLANLTSLIGIIYVESVRKR